jgi:hypothetical protein
MGLPRSTLVRCDWRGCALYSRAGCLAAGQLSVPAHGPILPSLLAIVPASRIHEASSSVHLRSPIQSFPNLDCADGSHAPSALPRASHLAVTSKARRNWEQAMRHEPGSRSAGNPPFSSRSTTTHPVRLRVARQGTLYLRKIPRFRCWPRPGSSVLWFAPSSADGGIDLVAARAHKTHPDDHGHDGAQD